MGSARTPHIRMRVNIGSVPDPLHAFDVDSVIAGYGRLMTDGDYWGLMGIYLTVINP